MKYEKLNIKSTDNLEKGTDFRTPGHKSLVHSLTYREMRLKNCAGGHGEEPQRPESGAAGAAGAAADFQKL